MCKVTFAWRGFFGFLVGEVFFVVLFFWGVVFFCGVLLLINFTKSTYTSCQPGFWPYQQKTKRKMQCFPGCGRCSFLKLGDHKEINASSKRMSILVLALLMSLQNPHQPLLIKSGATLCVCALTTDRASSQSGPVRSRLNWPAEHRGSAIDCL